MDGTGYYANFVIFCVLYSTTHATVDAVLAFSAAELGPSIGSIGGFILYIFYTASSLLAAKPVLRTLGSKNGVLVGLVSLLVYVTTFLLAVIFRASALPLFAAGCAIGGGGAGILWTSHGSYYASNVDYYTAATGMDKAKIINNFAAIFAMTYLFMEAGFKLMATLIFATSTNHSNGDNASYWKVAVFGIYTAAALGAVLLFSCTVLSWDTPASHANLPASSFSQHGLIVEMTQRGSTHDEDDVDTESETECGTESEASIGSGGWEHGGVTPVIQFNPLTTATRPGTEQRRTKFQLLHEQENNDSTSASAPRQADSNVPSICDDVFAVFRLIITDAKLQCLLPFQACFGLHAALINTYINAVVVKDNIGDGYIGLLAGIAALTAVAIAAPCAYIANFHPAGKYMIMLAGAVFFAFSGAAVLLIPIHILSQWSCIVPYFIIHGAARGIWENTNKAVVADYFPDPNIRETAYAAVYFCNGISGAMGFLLFGWFAPSTKAIVVLVTSILAGITYHFSAVLHTHAPSGATGYKYELVCCEWRNYQQDALLLHR